MARSGRDANCVQQAVLDRRQVHRLAAAVDDPPRQVDGHRPEAQHGVGRGRRQGLPPQLRAQQYGADQQRDEQRAMRGQRALGHRNALPGRQRASAGQHGHDDREPPEPYRHCQQHVVERRVGRQPGEGAAVVATAVPSSTSSGPTRMAIDTIFISCASTFSPRHSGVRPIIKPAMKTAMIANISMPYRPEPMPPKRQRRRRQHRPALTQVADHAPEHEAQRGGNQEDRQHLPGGTAAPRHGAPRQSAPEQWLPSPEPAARRRAARRPGRR